MAECNKKCYECVNCNSCKYCVLSTNLQSCVHNFKGTNSKECIYCHFCDNCERCNYCTGCTNCKYCVGIDNQHDKQFMIGEYQCKDYIEWMSTLCMNIDLDCPCYHFEEAIEAGLNNCIYEREEWEKKNKELTEKIDKYYKESTK